MTDLDQKEYFNYLKSGSLFGKYYRPYYLYPKVNRHLSGRTLDVGCGVGDFIKSRNNTIGVDINPHCVKHCKDNGLEAYYFKTPNYDFENNTFNSVLLDNVLEHIDNPFEILNEIFRVLKPGGLFVVGVPGKKGFKKDPDHKIFYDEEILNNTLQKFGFINKYFFYAPFKSEYLNKHLNPYCIFGVYIK